MKPKDGIWILILISFTLFVVLPMTSPIFIRWTTNNPYLMGFVKTALLATMGEVLVYRIKTTRYHKPGLIYRVIIWGLLGMVFVLVFKVFASGVISAQDAGLLPRTTGWTNTLIFALMTSTLMNLFFAPAFMLFHRVTDTYLDLSKGSLSNMMKIPINDAINHIDFNQFVSFILFKTIPFFWIPAHTVTFMLPEVYRVLMAGYLSIILGILLTIKKTKTA